MPSNRNGRQPNGLCRLDVECPAQSVAQAHRWCTHTQVLFAQHQQNLLNNYSRVSLPWCSPCLQPSCFV
jgi:hypothetical protein